MNCKNLKIRQKNYKKYICCTKLKKEIKFSDCNNCEYKEYKKQKTIKKRSYSLSKKEKKRFSIITHNLDKCIICGRKRDNLHEIFYGKNRQKSIEYGLVVPLCVEHHTGTDGIHFNRNMDLYFKRIGQDAFCEKYPTLSFMEIFGKNYK